MNSAEDFFAHESAQLRPEQVTYLVEVEGRVVVVENVPARVNQETGEQFFSPETLAKLFQIVRGGTPPQRYVSAPVYSFAA